MDPLFLWQVEFIDLFVYWMQNLKRFKELCLQLPVLFGLDVFAIQPNFIIGDIASRLNAFIMSLLLKFLSVVQIFLANNYWLF